MRVSVFAGVLLVAAGVMALMPGMGNVMDFIAFGTDSVRIERTADAGSVDSIRIDAGVTDVTLVPRPGHDIVVTLNGTTGSRQRDKWKLTLEQQGSELAIAPEVPKVMFAGFSSRREELKVELPENMWALVDVRTGSGDVRAESLRAAGGISFRTGSGDIHAEKLEGMSIRMKLASGDVKVDGIKAEDIGLETGSGDIRAADYDAGALAFKTGSGDVALGEGIADLSGTTGSGDIRVERNELNADTMLRSGSGDVTILLNGAPQSLAFDFKTVSGGSSVEWPYTKGGGEPNDNGGRTGTFGGGERKLEVKTGSGDIKLGER